MTLKLGMRLFFFFFFIAGVIPIVFQMMTPSWSWPILQQGQIWSLLFVYGKDLQETNEASLSKVSQIKHFETFFLKKH